MNTTYSQLPRVLMLVYSFDGWRFPEIRGTFKRNSKPLCFSSNVSLSSPGLTLTVVYSFETTVYRGFLGFLPAYCCMLDQVAIDAECASAHLSQAASVYLQ